MIQKIKPMRPYGGTVITIFFEVYISPKIWLENRRVDLLWILQVDSTVNYYSLNSSQCEIAYKQRSADINCRCTKVWLLLYPLLVHGQ